jgi:hypothetical protein
MKHLTVCLFLSLVVFSCTSKVKNEYNNGEIVGLSEQDSTSFNQAYRDSLRNYEVFYQLKITEEELAEIIKNNKFDDIRKDTTISDRIPSITPLPFGPKISAMDDFYNGNYNNGYFYLDLIGKDLQTDTPKYTPTYLLPPIKQFKHIGEFIYSTPNCRYNIPMDSLLKFRTYKKRLPDMGRFQVYYMCNDLTKHSIPDFPSAYKKYCIDIDDSYDSYYTSYGYLILYNQEQLEATILFIYYDYFIESPTRMIFYIDKDYNIFINTISYSEGEDKVDVFLACEKINISDNGEIKYENIISINR